MSVEIDRATAAAGDSSLLLACLEQVCAALLDSEAQLSELDRAIGDGDHGSNVARAARALLEQKDALAQAPVAAAIEQAGTTVVMSVGGASGPLYGSLLMSMGRSWQEPRTLETAADALAEGVAAVARRGRSKEGEKTMLDVLIPAADAFRAGGSAAERWRAILRAADDGLEATRPLRATKGRAAFVGERSIGHLDAGAASSRLAIHAVARALGYADEEAAA